MMVEYTGPADMAPETSVVKASSEGIEASTGDYMLKVVTKPGVTVYANWLKLRVIPQKIMEACGITNIPKEEIGNWELKFDVYAVGKAANRHFCIEPTTTENKRHAYYMNLRRNAWCTNTIDLGDAKLPSNWPFNTGAFVISYGEYVTDGECTLYFDNFRLEKKA